MESPTQKPPRLGRPASGRETEPFNCRMERSITRRLEQAATRERPQRAIVEAGLQLVLPPDTAVDPLS